MTRSLDFTACNLPCEHPCWRRLTKEEIEWLEKNPNRQYYTTVCIEKQDNETGDNKIQAKDEVHKFNVVKNFIIENNLHKTMYKSRMRDCIDKISESEEK